MKDYAFLFFREPGFFETPAPEYPGFRCVLRNDKFRIETVIDNSELFAEHSVDLWEKIRSDVDRTEAERFIVARLLKALRCKVREVRGANQK